MRINYNFAFKNSKLTPWERPAPPNLLISDADLDKKILYILKQYNSNKILYYPSTIVLASALIVQILNFYPQRIVKKFKSDHNTYQNMVAKLRNLDSSKQKFNQRITKIDPYFTKSTTSYLFSYFLQNSVPKGVQINRYAFNDNGFEISVSAFNLDSLDDFITLLIDSPVILKDSVRVNKITRTESSNSNNLLPLPDLELEIYGEVKKINQREREALYLKSNADGLLKKLQRFNKLKQKLGS